MILSLPAPHWPARVLGGVLACAFAVLPLAAQPADTFFHTAANQYIGGQDGEALASVEAGLRIAPRDARLLRLKAEIEKKQQEQQKQEQNQKDQQEKQDGEQQDKQGNQGEEKEDDKGQQSDKGQNGPPEQQDKGEPGDEENPQRPEQKPGESPEPEEGESKDQQGRPQPDPSKLSKAEAERILQALGNEEETLLRRVARPQSRARRVEKDW